MQREERLHDADAYRFWQQELLNKARTLLGPEDSFITRGSLVAASQTLNKLVQGW